MEKIKKEKEVVLAGVLSFLFPGLGQAYCECYSKAVVCFFITLLGYFCFIIPGIVFSIIQIADAVWCAKRHNEGKGCWK